MIDSRTIENPDTVTRTTFRDADQEAAFQRDGYVVVDFATPEIVEALLESYTRLNSGIDSGYYPSLMSPDQEYKAAANEEVGAIVWPLLNGLIEGYEPLVGYFMVKHPGPDTEVSPHQDWILADESAHSTMGVWLALTEVTEQVGQMKVLPGSHKWLTGLRGSPGFPMEWEAEHERVRDELMVTVPIQVGQAMVYDIRVLHGTAPNRSQSTRVIGSLYALAEGSTPIHFYKSPEGIVQGYEIADDFYTTFMIGDVPPGEPFVEIEDYSVEQLSFDEIASRYAASRS
ncbi:protein involved in biosynthesis of mitomycin antibiotics/polyketide fumonisin [Actinobacteria bacterium IMCC26207]|nr:protein involved in biosynthesis of mitomycin antibiotics/polyketide fumonisin [Actinobacteria bacterium IMCC26207]